MQPALPGNPEIPDPTFWSTHWPLFGSIGALAANAIRAILWESYIAASKLTPSAREDRGERERKEEEQLRSFAAEIACVLVSETCKAGRLDDGSVGAISQMVADAAISSRFYGPFSGIGWTVSSVSYGNNQVHPRFAEFIVLITQPYIQAALARVAAEASHGSAAGASVHAMTDTKAERAARRQAFIMPILERKGWTRGKLVTEAGVSKGTVYGYIDGSRHEIEKDNRQAIADALGISIDHLPK